MVTLNNITYTKKNNNIINNLSLTCPNSKITFIIGPNGSGKTTTLEIIDLLLKPSNGEININNNITTPNTKDKEISNIRKNIGIMFQNPETTFLGETVQEELTLSMNIFKYNSENRKLKIENALKMVGLNLSILNRSPLSLNKNYQKKLALACTIINNPSVILLDEPTVGMDNMSKEELVKLIRRLKQKYNKTIIITSHDMDFVLKLADYIYVLNQGTKVMEGTKYEIFKEEEKLKIYNLVPPSIIRFINEANKITKLRYRDEVNDLIKDIYRSVR